MAFYLPLPDNLTIKNSEIHGLGLYATKSISAGTNLGITHIKTDIPGFQDGYIRTPLGGFFNHSSTPNCEVVHDGDFIYLKTLEDIGVGDELTAFYTLYNPEETEESKAADKFVEDLKAKCDANGVKYHFPKTKHVLYPGFESLKVSGYFLDKPEPALACAMGKPLNAWFEILIHESCHMDQWIEKSAWWLNLTKDGYDCDKKMDEWLTGSVEYSKNESDYFMLVMQAVEIDCERRSVEKIKSLNLPVNIENYVKKANAYIFSYNIMKETGKWCDIAPYEIPEIIELMPDSILKEEEYEQISDKIKNIYLTKCYL